MRIFIFCAEYNNVSVVMQIFVIHTFMCTVVLFVYIDLHILLLCSSAIPLMCAQGIRMSPVYGSKLLVLWIRTCQ